MMSLRSDGRAHFARLEREVRFGKDAASVVAGFNADVAPYAATEEALLEPLSLWVAYQPLEVGMRIELPIAHDLHGNDRSGHYDTAYVVAAVRHDPLSPFDPRGGVTAFRLVPAHRTDRTEIHLFRGTDPLAGWGADMDPRGVGHRAYDHEAPTLQTWIDDAAAQGRAITSTGHSLGGALALRHHARIGSAQGHAVTFCAPGIDVETANGIVHAVHIQNERDIVGRAGGARPGTTWRAAALDGASWRDFFTAHSRASLLQAELCFGRASLAPSVSRVDVADPSPAVESMRWTVGALKGATGSLGALVGLASAQ
jgi:hypothetical protein